MARNGSGSFSLVAGNPVTIGTQITATWANNTLSDIASELTGSVAADGQTTITGPIKFSAGSVSAPAMTFSSETNTGFYRSASSVVSLSIAGSQKYIFGASSVTLGGSASITGTEFGYLTGVTSAIQTQLDAKQALDAQLTTLAGITAQQATDLASVSTFIGTLLDDSTAIAARATMKLAQISPVTATVAANALTLGLNATSLDFRSTTLTTGVPNARDVPSAISLVVPSTATLGTVNASAARLVLLAIDNAGTVELAVVNLSGGNNLDETTLISTTAISEGADSNNVIYSTTARTNVPFRVVGFIDITEATAGTWATAPTLVQGAGGNSLASLGTGQTWQDVIGSRALSTTYYNTTGNMIFVNATQTYGSVAGPTMTINGVAIFGALTSTTATQSGYLWPIPAGASYSLAGGTLISWKELR